MLLPRLTVCAREVSIPVALFELSSLFVGAGIGAAWVAGAGVANRVDCIVLIAAAGVGLHFVMSQVCARVSLLAEGRGSSRRDDRPESREIGPGGAGRSPV